MVSKCINPYCNRPFRYLSAGKLFVTEYPATFAAGVIVHSRTREHFLLCEDCARSMTVAVRREHGGISIRIVNLAPNGERKIDFKPGKEITAIPLSDFRPQVIPEPLYGTF